MRYEHNDREYQVGVSRAHLRLALEGCKTTLDPAYGEAVLNPVEEEDSVDVQSSVGAKAQARANSGTGARAGALVAAGVQSTRNRKLNQKMTHLPVVAGPNESWEIKLPSVSANAKPKLEGTAIPSERLCILQRNEGGNRMAITGEVQVSKSAINISAKGGNKIGKTLGEWRNKDTIVAQILKRAIQREAFAFNRNRTPSIVAISQCEILEE